MSWILAIIAIIIICGIAHMYYTSERKSQIAKQTLVRAALADRCEIEKCEAVITLPTPVKKVVRKTTPKKVKTS